MTTTYGAMPSETAVFVNGVNAAAATAPARARRLRGLRMPVLPSGTLLAQLGGGLATLGGVYLAAGVAVTLIVGGIAATVLGALREAGKV